MLQVKPTNAGNGEMTVNPDTPYYLRKGLKYARVTSIIANYTPEYNTWYWSLYKAIKDTLYTCGRWSSYKYQAGGWERVVSYYAHHPLPQYKEAIVSRQNYYIRQWAIDGKQARDAGHLIHELKEKELVLPAHDGEVEFEWGELTGNAVYAEVRIYNDALCIAGRADKVERSGAKVTITDYKTCKRITTEPFADEMLKPPLDSIPHANYYIYALQLSLYGWMLEQLGYQVSALFIDHLDREDGTRIRLYQMEYRKHDIELMLDDYGRKEGRTLW
jgi:hypothetical protein